jgi:hypothetical protein
MFSHCTSKATTAAALVLVLSGCAAPAGAPATAIEPEEQVGKTSEALISDAFNWGWYYYGFNYWLVGRGLNGTDLNGKALDGHGVLGVSLRGVKKDGAALHDVWLANDQFYAEDSHNKLVGPSAFVGVEFTAVLDNGEQTAVRIDAIEPGERGVPHYTVTYATKTGRNSLCGSRADGTMVRAVALNGRWDYRLGVRGGGSRISDSSAFTFACEGFVLEKCVEMGYEPWRSGWVCNHSMCGYLSLEDHHQACTRAVRADYCGDGNSYTQDGTPLNTYDGVGIRRDMDKWPFEAEWDDSGARCVTRRRSSATAKPPCWDKLDNEKHCGDTDHFRRGGTLLMTEDQP